MTEQARSDDLKRIDAQIAALRQQRADITNKRWQTYEEYARLPLQREGIGMIRSASGAMVAIACGADTPEDGGVQWQRQVAKTVVLAVNHHDELVEALKGLRALILSECGQSTYECADGERADAVLAKVDVGDAR